LLLSTLRIEPLVLAFEVVAPVLLEVVVIPIGITAKVGGAETGLPGAMFVWPPGFGVPGSDRCCPRVSLVRARTWPRV
jgi:hypothetical protein